METARSFSCCTGIPLPECWAALRAASVMMLLEVGGESVRGGLLRRYHLHELLQCRCVAPGGRDAGDVLHPECLFYVFSYIFCHITARKPDE